MDEDNKNNKSQSEDKLPPVIPFDSGDSKPNDDNKDDASLEELLGTLKSAFGDLKKELAPLKDSFIELVQAMRENLAEVTKEVQDAAEESLKTKLNEQNATASDAKATNDILSLGLNVFKNKADATGDNLHTIVSREFAQFADQKLTEDDYKTDENGKRHVVINSAFLQKHGTDFLPSLIKNTLDNIVKALFGDSDFEAIMSKAYGPESAAQSAEKPENAEAPEPSHDYDVKLDLADNWTEAMRNVKVPHLPDAQNDDAESPERTERIRELFIEGGRIIEDAINGKSVGDTADRLRQAASRAQKPAADDSLTEEQIRILDSTKKFENAMNPDNKDE